MEHFDLNLEYKKLNNDIFNSQLPDNVPVKWNHSKTAMGKTRIRKHSNGSFDLKITISKFFICTEKEYRETLIHEMIHVLMVSNNEFRIDKRVHGPLFRKYMNQINNDFPQYRISVKETKSLPVDKIKIKNQQGFFLTFHGKYYFNLYYSTIDERLKKRIKASVKRGFNIKMGSIYFFSGKYEEIASAPVRRTIRTLTGNIQYLRDKDKMESLFQKVKKDFPQNYTIP